MGTGLPPSSRSSRWASWSDGQESCGVKNLQALEEAKKGFLRIARLIHAGRSRLHERCRGWMSRASEGREETTSSCAVTPRLASCAARRIGSEGWRPPDGSCSPSASPVSGGGGGAKSSPSSTPTGARSPGGRAHHHEQLAHRVRQDRSVRCRASSTPGTAAASPRRWTSSAGRCRQWPPRPRPGGTACTGELEAASRLAGVQINPTVNPCAWAHDRRPVVHPLAPKYLFLD
jgi:hypothetical protein